MKLYSYVSTLILVLSGFPAESQLPSKLDTISNITEPPFNKICHLGTTRKHLFDIGTYQSTGFFIAPNIILTAGHNVFSMFSTKVVSVVITPGKYNLNMPFDSLVLDGSNTRQFIHVHRKFSFLKLKSWRAKWDFAIIVIPDSVLNVNSKILPDQVFTLDPDYTLKQGDTIYVAGYPADPKYKFNGDFITFQFDTCGYVNQKTFIQKLATYRGNSGSPIWVVHNGKRIVVGVHTYDGTDTKLDQENMSVLQSWLKQYGDKYKPN